MQNKMEIQYIGVDEITAYSRNAKKHPDEQVEHIANSIREFGFRQPLVIDRDGVLVIGHGRLLAAKKLGLKTVPCVRADDLTDEQVKALRLADNKTNESAWDDDLLNLELDDIFDLDMEDFGFDLSEIRGGAYLHPPPKRMTMSRTCRKNRAQSPAIFIFWGGIG